MSLQADYTARQRASALRRMLRGIKPAISPDVPVGGAVSPDNPASMLARGQISSIHDVLDADGNEIFTLGATGLTDDTVVE